MLGKNIPEDNITASRTVIGPFGELVLFASDNGICGCFFAHRVPEELIIPENASPFLDQAEEQLTEYFSGDRQSFDLKLDTSGTEFQKSVWDSLRRIPFGYTKSYGDIAEEIGNPKAVRAVGLANGANPVSVIVPCHRVIGADGTLTGFGGGLDMKRKLLEHEGVLLKVS